RLASELTGWVINVMTEEEADEKQEEEAGRLVTYFEEKLDVDEDIAAILAEEGFTTLEEVAYVPLEEMLGIEGFDENIVTELRQRAKDMLLTLELASEEQLDSATPSDDLLGLDGMDEHLARLLASKGIATMEDLAEQSIDDLMDIDDMDEERAGQLIMAARAPWFENE
ncbi:MAG: helix-hairpin-helix domain-containing protein, partial [Saccharospirillum sp.]